MDYIKLIMLTTKKGQGSVGEFIRGLSESAPVWFFADPTDQVSPHWLQLDASLQDWPHSASILGTD